MKFLQQVASYYSAKADQGLNLGKYTFVLPNQRSAMFLRKYLRQLSSRISFQPKIVTITAFTQMLSGTELAEPLELLYILYNAYLRVMKEQPSKEEPMEFDAFAHWGIILLDDFNEIDAYLADSDQLFKNINDEREIRSYFLTPSQKRAAEALGLSTELAEDEKKGFWAHVKGEGNAKEKFIHRWQLLGPVYQEFQKLLGRHHLSYSGQQSKDAYLRAKEASKEDFYDQRFAFVGFNVLSTSRLLIFLRFKELGIGEFFWDTAFLGHTLPGSKAGQTVSRLAKCLPAPDDFSLQPITSYPEIHFYPVPSNVGQAKVASHVVKAIENPNTVETGVIMARADLMVPFLYALPDNVSQINVAMKVPYSNTPFWALIGTIINMQEHARKIRQEFCYFYKDVIEVISHPYLSTISYEGCQRIKNLISEAHLYNVPASDLCQIAPHLEFIFKVVDNVKDLDEVFDYMTNLIEQLRVTLENLNIVKRFGNVSLVTPYEITVLEAYRKHVDKIYDLAHRHSITMGKGTFFSLLRRLLSNEHISINGEPLEGMQIMGIEESRVLDFNNLLILSLNERIFPKRSFSPSYIPPGLRAGYGLPLNDVQDEAVAYHFYRLISRAKKVNLFYDSRTPDLSAGEASRFVTQMQMLLSPSAYTVHELQLGLSMGDRRILSIEKTSEVLEELSMYTEGRSRKNFSASLLKTYIQCPLRFYLEKVKGLSIEDNNLEYMDPASYGTIMHKLAQEFYESLRDKYGNQFLSPETMKDEINRPGFENELVQRARVIMNHEYYRDKHDVTTSGAFFPGEGRVLSGLMAKYLIKMLEAETENGPFKYEHGEYNGDKKQHLWKFDPSMPAINFTMSIDRIDEIPGTGRTLRFIDYKTGKEDSTSSTIDALFTNPTKSAIFQLFTYSLAYHDLVDSQAHIQPFIYSFPLLVTKGLKPISIGRNNLVMSLDDPGVSGKPLLEEFRDGFTRLIKEIFNPDIPFTQTEDDERCKYCAFLQICGRQKNNDEK